MIVIVVVGDSNLCCWVPRWHVIRVVCLARLALLAGATQLKCQRPFGVVSGLSEQLVFL